jgi:hypothetical protein
MLTSNEAVQQPVSENRWLSVNNPRRQHPETRMDVMSGSGSPPAAVLQLRVVLAGISPLIWRRLLVTEQTTIAEGCGSFAGSSVIRL